MTDTDRAAPPAFLRRFRHGHPVLSFVLAAAVVALPLLALERSGAVDPRLHTRGAAVEDSSQAVYFVELTNQAPLAVEVEGVDTETRGLGDVRTSLLAPSSTLAELGSWSPAGAPSARPDRPLEWGHATEVVAPSLLHPGATRELDARAERLQPFTLDPGDSRVLVVRAAVRCARPSLDGVRVEVRTPVGAVRTVGVSGGIATVADACV